MKIHLDPLDKLLFLGILAFSAIIFISNIMFPMDGQIFQTYSSVLAGFTGAFFGRMAPRKDQAHPPAKPDAPPAQPEAPEPPK